MGIFSKSYCPCGSRKERGFCTECSHGSRRSIPTGTFKANRRGELKPVKDKRR